MTPKELRSEQSACPVCGGRGWHTAGGNDPMACGRCPAGEAFESEIECAPRCDACGVTYAVDYEGPCQEPRGRYVEGQGWTAHCPGRVSWRATAEAFYEREQHRQSVRDYKAELFKGRDRTQDPRPQRAPGC